MNKSKILSAIAALAVSAAPLFALDQYFVVTLTDMTGEKTFYVREKDEVKELQKTIAAEAKLFPKILAAKKKEWDAEPDTHEFKWQGNKLKPRQIKVSSPYADKEKADAKADKLTDKELGIDDDSTKKKKKKQTDADKEKEYQESLKLNELKSLAQDIQKELDKQLKETAK